MTTMQIMRTNLNLEDEALLVAKRYASREKLSLGEDVSRLVRQGAQQPPAQPKMKQALRGRFALLPARDEVITAGHTRALMESEGI
jgi:hypothetical protein